MAAGGCGSDPDKIVQTDPAPSSGDPGTGSATGPTTGAGPTAPACAGDNGGLTLPAGFCATVFADRVGPARQIAVTPSGRVFVAIEASSDTANDAHVLALYDGDGDGVAEQSQTIAGIGGNGIAWQDGQLYVAANDQIVRYAVADGALAPDPAAPTVVVGGLPADGDHFAKSVALIGHDLFINVGSPSNACQEANRQPHSPGKDPCDELATRAGVWKFDATVTDQTQSCGTRIGTGMRNTNALAVEPTGPALWGGINGRDQLHDNWPELFTAGQDNLMPSDEVVAVVAGTDRGWPYCYHDVTVDQMKLAPEYGGDGTIQGRCAAIASPAVALPAHAAVLSMVFASGTQFPAAYQAGAFIANHGSRFDASAAASELHGYDVEFIPFTAGQPSGAPQKFATGFDAGLRPLPDAAPHRPVGLAMLPDGSLLIGDDVGGRIWRVTYTAPAP
ncbi:MAG TPA: hypothetical protein VH165_10745 [Kofleriaceae bacterium]|nr:hypothetical protein [Kofleriaceae bacterium]